MSCHTSYGTFRAPQTCQDKAQSAGNGMPLPRTATQYWRVCGAPSGQGEKRPSAVLRSLELAQLVLHSRALQLAASRLAESAI